MLNDWWEEYKNSIGSYLVVVVVLGLVAYIVISGLINESEPPPPEQPIVYMTDPIQVDKTIYQIGDSLVITFRRCNNSEETIFGQFVVSLVDGGPPLVLSSGELGRGEGIPPGCSDFSSGGHTVIPNVAPGVYRTSTSLSYKSDSTASDCNNGFCANAIDSELFEVVE